jgi:hypothetical protein
MATCPYTATNSITSGDRLYAPRGSFEPFMLWAWEQFDFDKEDWDDGRGYEAVTDETTPLNRTLNGLWCLTYSGAVPPDSHISSTSAILNWGWRYAQNKIDELDDGCNSGGAVAATQIGFGVDHWTQLYEPFFDQPVSLRAGTLVHEARHADGVVHDAGTNDSSWAFEGAWRWQVCWLGWFVTSGRASTPALKAAARQRANAILANNFVTKPGFVL